MSNFITPFELDFSFFYWTAEKIDIYDDFLLYKIFITQAFEIVNRQKTILSFHKILPNSIKVMNEMCVFERAILNPFLLQHFS